MAPDLAASRPGWLALLRGHAGGHVPAALGLGLGWLAVLALLMQRPPQAARRSAQVGVASVQEAAQTVGQQLAEFHGWIAAGSGR